MTRFVAAAFLGSWLLTAQLAPRPLLAQDLGSWRTIDVETREVTSPDLAIAPDGRWLVFTMLGHLFRVPVEGGQAEQLTFGPSFNARPAVSPDGNRIAFRSDRDDSDGNIFLFDLTTGGVTQVTQTGWADAPAWSPDGRSIAYLVHEWMGWDITATVWTTELASGRARRVDTGGGDVHSPFYLPDGRVGWAVIAEDAVTGEEETRIEVMAPDGSVPTLLTIPGIARSVAPTDDGFIARREHPLDGGEYLTRLNGPSVEDEPIVAAVDGDAIRSFAVSPINGSLYVGSLGRLWSVPPGDRRRVPVPFHATARVEVREPTAAPTWSSPRPATSRPPRGILFPRLSSDGETMVFLAARSLWLQQAGAIRKLTEYPVGHPAISPDGRHVALAEVRSEGAYYCGRSGGRLLVIDTATGETIELEAGNAGPDYAPTWTPDGRRVVIWGSSGSPPCQRFDLVAIGLDGAVDTLVAGATGAGMHTSASPDGQWIYYVTKVPEAGSSYAPAPGMVFRVSLTDRSSSPEPVASLGILLSADLEGTQFGRVSPDGRWFAFRPYGRRDIRVARLDGGDVAFEDTRVLTGVGGASGFDFDATGSALIYSTPEGVWRHPLAGGDAEHLPVVLRLTRPEAPEPVLIRRVRALDFESGGFTPETSILIDGGRIASIGAVAEASMPNGVRILDAGGRYAIPGLFDVHAHSGVAIGDRGRSALSYGVTTLRSPGGLVHHNAQLADQEFTGAPSARWFYAGDIINGQGGSGTRLRSVDDAWNEVRLLNAWGASFVKPYTDLPWPLHRAVGDAARSVGLPILRHGNNMEQVVKSIQAGGMLTHSSDGYEDLLRLMAAVGMRTDPTLSGVASYTVRAFLYPERYPNGAPLRPFGEFVDTDRDLGVWARELQSVRRADRMGVTVLAGTDVDPIGSTLHFELELLADAGMEPIDVLRAATIYAAESVGAGAELGALEVGRVADIVLLDANPLEDIANTERIWRVVKDGVVHRPGDLRPSPN